MRKNCVKAPVLLMSAAMKPAGWGRHDWQLRPSAKQEVRTTAGRKQASTDGDPEAEFLVSRLKVRIKNKTKDILSFILNWPILSCCDFLSETCMKRRNQRQVHEYLTPDPWPLTWGSRLLCALDLNMDSSPFTHINPNRGFFWRSWLKKLHVVIKYEA